MKINEAGRSMTEMLGVLGIIGVISVGGYSMVGKSIAMRHNARIIADAAHLAMSARKLACQYDTGYSSYSGYLYKSEAYPSGLTYNDGVFTGVEDVTYSLSYSSGTITMTIGHLNEDQCLRVATSDWGTLQSSGYQSMSIGSANVGSSGSLVSIGKAAEKCAKGNTNTIELKYKGCRS